jgi:hypothetical protein
VRNQGARRRLNNATAAMAFCGVVGLLAGCSADPPPAEEPQVVVTASPTASDLATETLPLDAYIVNADQVSDIDFATKLLAKACMKRFGVDWNTGGRISPPNNGRNYGLGLVDAVRAATYGYHPTPAERASQDSSQDTGRDLTDEQAILLGGVGPGQPAKPGVPDGGCYGEARRQLAWDDSVYMWLQQLAVQAMRRTLEHANTQAANARWSACMKAAGHTYATPNDANNNQSWWRDDDAGPSEREINTAVADVRCKTETNYVGELTAVLVANQQKIVEDNLERLQATRGQIREALKRAADVLAKPPA